jgi:hypothetical protein
MPKDGSFSNRKESQKERLRFLPAPMVGLGRSVSRVEMNAKYSALDTALPKQTLPYALFTAKGPEKSLDKADTVIHGAPCAAGDIPDTLDRAHP